MVALNTPHEFVNGEPADADEVNENFAEVEARVNERIDRAGDTMEGPLLLPDASSGDAGNAAATRDFVEETMGLISGVQVAQSGSVSVSLPSGGASASVDGATGRRIVFPQRFRTPPTVVATAVGNIDNTSIGVLATGSMVVTMVDGIREHDFLLAARLATEGGAPTSVDVNWIAVGELA